MKGKTDIKPNAVFTNYDGIEALLEKSRKPEIQKKNIRNIIKSVYKLTRRITESLYRLKMQYELKQKDATICKLTQKVDDLHCDIKKMSLEMKQVLDYGKSMNLKLDDLSTRVIVPITTQSQQELLILLHLSENIYYTIRAQERCAKVAFSRQLELYPEATEVMRIECNSNSVSTMNALRKLLKQSNVEVNGNTIVLDGNHTEKWLVSIINKIYKNRLN
jgi:hypothetical protein